MKVTASAAPVSSRREGSQVPATPKSFGTLAGLALPEMQVPRPKARPLARAVRRDAWSGSDHVAEDMDGRCDGHHEAGRRGGWRAPTSCPEGPPPASRSPARRRGAKRPARMPDAIMMRPGVRISNTADSPIRLPPQGAASRANCVIVGSPRLCARLTGAGPAHPVTAPFAPPCRAGRAQFRARQAGPVQPVPTCPVVHPAGAPGPRGPAAGARVGPDRCLSGAGTRPAAPAALAALARFVRGSATRRSPRRRGGVFHGTQGGACPPPRAGGAAGRALGTYLPLASCPRARDAPRQRRRRRLRSCPRAKATPGPTAPVCRCARGFRRIGGRRAGDGRRRPPRPPGPPPRPRPQPTCTQTRPPSAFAG
jgi:hypothetical protein